MTLSEEPILEEALLMKPEVSVARPEEESVVAARVVKVPATGVEAPMTVFSIVPPDMVNAPTTMASVMELAGSETDELAISDDTLRLVIVDDAMVVVVNVVVAENVLVPVKVVLALAVTPEEVEVDIVAQLEPV